jgi:hypothetical protein
MGDATRVKWLQMHVEAIWLWYRLILITNLKVTGCRCAGVGRWLLATSRAAEIPARQVSAAVAPQYAFKALVKLQSYTSVHHPGTFVNNIFSSFYHQWNSQSPLGNVLTLGLFLDIVSTQMSPPPRNRPHHQSTLSYDPLRICKVLSLLDSVCQQLLPTPL